MINRNRFENYLQNEYRPQKYNGIQKERLEPKSILHYMSMLDYIAADLTGYRKDELFIGTADSFFSINDIETLELLQKEIENQNSFKIDRNSAVKKDMRALFRYYIAFLKQSKVE